MTFVSRPTSLDAPDEPEDLAVIANDGFFPDIDPAEIRKAGRISSTVTAPRLRAALVNAIITARNDLAAWADTQTAAGYATLAAVPAVVIDGKSHMVQCYIRAVTAFAKAEVIERYRDFDTTAAGGKGLQELDTTVDDLRRDAAHAVRDILGRGRTSVELI